MNSEFAARIQALIDAAGGINALARIFNVSPGNIINWRDGARAFDSTLHKVAERTGLDFEWLRSGEGDIEHELNKLRAHASEPAAKYRAEKKIPLISWATAGKAMIDFDDVVDWDGFLERGGIRDPRAIAVTVRGDSMMPVIQEGDIVILLCSQKPISNNVVVARLKAGGVICKLFQRTGTDGKTFRLSSYNAAYPPLDLHEEDFVWLYPVGEMRRNFMK